MEFSGIVQGLDRTKGYDTTTARMDGRMGSRIFLFPGVFSLSLLFLFPSLLLRRKERMETYFNVFFNFKTLVHCTYFCSEEEAPFSLLFCPFSYPIFLGLRREHTATATLGFRVASTLCCRWEW
jgi:hypothetical protein